MRKVDDVHACVFFGFTACFIGYCYCDSLFLGGEACLADGFYFFAIFFLCL